MPGATDDKGQMFTHLKAAEGWLKTVGRLPLNLKILIEGEEEVGGASLETFVAENRAQLACDYAVISDTSQFARDQPAITYGLKGLAYFEVIVRGAKNDLHSGTFGGAVANPCNALATILASLKGPDNRIADRWLLRPGPAPRRLGRAEFARLPFSETEFQASLGVVSLEGEAGYTTLERKWARPTCDVNGLYGGYQGPGPKTVLPCMAGAKLSFRLVPDQDPKTVAAQFRAHVRTVCPPACPTRSSTTTAHRPCWSIPRPKASAPLRAIEAGFGKPPVFIREGGSIPVVGLLKTQLGVDTLLARLGPERRQPPRPEREVRPRRLSSRHQGQRPPAGGAGQWVRRPHRWGLPRNQTGSRAILIEGLPMLDLKYVLANIDAVKQNCRNRNMPADIVDEVDRLVVQEGERKSLLQAVEEVRRRRTKSRRRPARRRTPQAGRAGRRGKAAQGRGPDRARSGCGSSKPRFMTGSAASPT